jgi:spore coat polysaccharide biosynthesis predicted glycosyltransferase SpsG/CMP-N-acetylneuraminic acid synthetase
MRQTDLLVLIHAPLHSAQLPRQVLRPLGGRPLLQHTIDIAAGVVASRRQLVVATDDDEVALLAERLGCRGVTDARAGLADAVESLLAEIVAANESGHPHAYRTVLLLRPTSPFVVPADIQEAHRVLADGGFDSVVSATDEAHHAWMRVNGRYVPDFGAVPAAERDGRIYRETGAFILTRRDAIRPDRFIGDDVGLAIVPPSRAIDITSTHQWWICERLLNRRRIVFVVAGNTTLGMGHIYRAHQLAHEIVNHEVSFVCPRDSALAADAARASGYPTTLQCDEPLADLVMAQAPHLVINDFLDTDASYVAALHGAGARVVSFEDLGTGACEADLVINELYVQAAPPANHRVGHEFFCIREEFLSVAPRAHSRRVEEVLITFGGTDAEDLTARTLEAIGAEAASRAIRVSIVTGTGYAHGARLERQVERFGSPLIQRANGTKRMSEFMARADLAISSAGRTLFELATMRVPTIVIASNEREETHPFASSHAGFRYLGRHDRMAAGAIGRAFVELVDDREARRKMRLTLEGFDFRRGRQRVLAELAAVLGAPVN